MGISVRSVLTAAAGLLLAAWWASRRARARGISDAVPGDLAIVLGISALVVGRFVALCADASAVGLHAFDPRAALNVTAGLSTPGALLGAFAAGVWLQRHGRVPEGAWRAIVPPMALGLAVWSGLSPLRDQALGIRAGFPFGYALPGADAARVPVGLIEAAVFALFAGLVWRVERKGSGSALARMSGSRLAALLLATAVAVHLLGSLLRPAVATVDGDLDALLALLLLGLAVLFVMDVGRATLRRAATAAQLVALLLGGALLLGQAGGSGQPVTQLQGRGEGGTPILPQVRGAGGAGVVVAKGPLPVWDEGDLAAYAKAVGKPLVVNVWASWCRPCRAEAPVFVRAAAAYGDTVAFLGLNVDHDPEAARSFARRYRLPFASVGQKGLRAKLGVVGLPTTVIIHPDGSIATRLIGGVDIRALAAAIDRAT